MEGRLGLTWGLSSIHGWGVFGLNLVRELLAHEAQGWPRPLLLHETSLPLIDEGAWPMLEPLISEQQRLAKNSAHLQGVGLRDTVVLHSSGNGLGCNQVSARYTGERNFGFTFFEETGMPDDAIRASAAFDGMLTGSNWNRDYLLERGIPNVKTVHQGVDTETFQPRPKSERYPGRFVVFSGGKLEYRKGQDLAVAAFKVFHARHPDALLLTVWQNPWPESVRTLAESSHVSSQPDTGGDPALTIPAWTRAEGLPDGAHIDLGIIANAAMPDILADADAALFPNRCEGGTNLVAMECMAAGLPCILSMNSGHLDIASEKNAYPLARQQQVDRDGTRLYWGESDVDEIVERLEEIYRDRAAAGRRAERAVADMRAMTWESQVGMLLDALAS